MNSTITDKLKEMKPDKKEANIMVVGVLLGVSIGFAIHEYFHNKEKWIKIFGPEATDQKKK